MIKIEIYQDDAGNWWAHVSQRRHTNGKVIASIGRKFPTNQDAWWWAQRKADTFKADQLLLEE